jgi:hypothetical protein
MLYAHQMRMTIGVAIRDLVLVANVMTLDDKKMGVLECANSCGRVPAAYPFFQPNCHCQWSVHRERRHGCSPDGR